MDNLEKEEMHDGVKLLLQRMRSHPEEFLGIGDEFAGHVMNGKWGGVLMQYWKILTQEEQGAIKAGLREANRHNFHAAVMKTILTEPRQESENLYAQAARKIQAQGLYDPRQSAVAGGAVQLGKIDNTATSGRISLGEYMENNMLGGRR